MRKNASRHGLCFKNVQSCRGVILLGLCFVLGSHSLTLCTRQYFLWYTILLPFYLPYSSLLSSPRLGMTAAALWVGTQVCPLSCSSLSRRFWLTSGPGSLAPTSLPTRIPRPQQIHTRSLHRRTSILRRQLLDFGDHCC